MRYILVEAPDPDQLTKLVQRLLDEGWELYGDPLFAPFSTRPAVYAQALTSSLDSQTAASPDTQLNSRAVLSLLQDSLKKSSD